MTASDVMTTPVVSVTARTPVRDAVRLMLERHVSGLPVVNERGELAGIVTEADLLLKEATPRPQAPVLDWFGRSLWLERWVSAYRKAEGRTVGDVMTHNVITAQEDTPLHELASTMIRYQVNRLPVVRGRQVVGIVTRADILRLFLRNDQTLTEEARRVVNAFVLFGEEIQVEAKNGVIVLRGRLGAPGRRNALLGRLWQIDGVVAIDDGELAHTFDMTVGTWE